MEPLSEEDTAGDVPIVTIVLGLLIPMLIYWFSTRNHSYWKNRGIPFEKPYPFIGSVASALTKKTFEEVELDRYKRLGRIHGFYEGNTPQLVVAEPELLKDILVKDFQFFTNRRSFNTGDPMADKMLSITNGEDWRRLRMIISPTFSTGKIKRMMSIFQDCAKTLIQNFKMATDKGEPADVLNTYGAFTMDVIISAAFSTKIDSHNDPENVFVKNAKAVLTQTFGIKFLFFMMFPKLMVKLGARAFAPESMDFFKKATLEIIAERERLGETRNDFLQLLLDIATEKENKEKEDEEFEYITTELSDDSTHDNPQKKTNKHLSMLELVAQCVSFFIGGYHTTAATLSLATYLVALNEKVQDKIFKEIEEVIGETNGHLEYESIQKLKYLDNVISETLRLYTPLIRTERCSNTDYKLGDTGITIPKGMIVQIPIYAMHHDPKFFPDPETFNPDRFSPEEKEKQIPYSYLPFGAGPRNCIATRFALMEIKVCLLYIFSSFQVKKCSQTKVPLEFGKLGGLIQPLMIKLNMVPRKESSLKI